MSENQTVINNYSVDIRQILASVTAGERTKLISLFVQNKVLLPGDNPGEYFAVSYLNWENRKDEDHKPETRLVPISTVAPKVEPEDAE